MKRILVLLHPVAYEREGDRVRSRLASQLPAMETTVLSLGSLGTTRDEELRGFDVLVAPTYPEILRVIRASENLRWIHFLSAGVDPIWGWDFDKTRYLMSKSTGVHAIPIAEYVIGCMLYFVKGLHRYRDQQREKRWERFWLEELTGKTVGVAGLGRVGRELARKAGAFDMKVVGTDRVEAPVAGVERVYPPEAFSDMVATADFLVLSLPLTEETRGLVNARVLGRMKRSAFLINVARGEVVHHDALVEALRDERIAGAALDVFEKEPLDPDSPLWSMSNVLITPHVAGTTPHYLSRALDLFVENHEGLMSAGGLVTPVDVRARY